MERDWTHGNRADEIEDAAERARERGMGSSGRPGIFNHHNCWRCHSGELPCVNGNPRGCEYPHARND